MGIKRAGGYIFITWKGDHPPLHVYIRNGRNRKIGRWDVEHQCPMRGDDFEVTKHLRKALYELGYLRGEP
jgi:hypothetical protein